MIFKHIILRLSIIDCHNYRLLKTYSGRGLLMEYKYNVSCSETVSKNWTPTAIDCYLLGCSCAKCHLYKIYFLNSERKCRMKETVIELVRRFGAPESMFYES